MKIGISLIIILCSFFLIRAISSASKKIPAEPPPLNDLTAEYTIQKKAHNFMISYNNGREKVCCIMIGYSPFQLEEYVGKKVLIRGDYLRYSNGQFVFSNTQCIAGKCHQIYNRINQESRVVTIDQMEVVP